MDRYGKSHFSGVLGLLTLCCLLSISPMDAAAQERWHVSRDVGADATAGVHRLLRDQSARFDLQGVELSTDARIRQWRGNRLVRVAQTYEGLPVFARGVLVRVDAQSTARTVVIHVSRRLDVIPVPILLPAEALEEAAFHWKVPRPALPSVELGVLDDGYLGALVWRVEGNGPRGRLRVLVDANDGRVLRSYLLYQDALGTVYPVNPVVTPQLEDRELPNLDGDESLLTGRAAVVYRYVAGTMGDFDNMTLEQLATSDGTGFFYLPVEPATDDPFAEVMAYYHVDWIDTYFRDQHGHVPTRALTVVVNYTNDSTSYENAHSAMIDANRHALIIGQGAVIDFVYDAETMYHEFTHFVIEEVAQLHYSLLVSDGLGMNIAPPGLHEGLADYFTGSVTDDATVFDYGDDHRYLDNDLVCPDDIFGQSHEDGRIVGGAMWEIRQTLGDALLTDDVVFGGLAQATPDTSLRAFAQGILDAAEALRDTGDLDQADVDTIRSILEARGMLACGRWLNLDGGVTRTTTEYGLDFVANYAGMGDCQGFRDMDLTFVSFFQYEATVPADAGQLTFDIQMTPANDLLYSVVVRRGEPVWFVSQGTPIGITLPAPQQYDYRIDSITSDTFQIHIGPESTPPLEPGEVYYLSILRQNCPTATIQVSASTQGPPGPDAGAPDASTDADGGAGDAGTGDGDGGSGCSCRQGASSGGSPLPLLPLLVLLGLGWIRRRPSRPQRPRRFRRR